MTITRNLLTIKDHTVHYREAGAGENIILLHEMPLSSDIFEHLMQSLQHDFHIIAPDLPGYGDSSPLNKPLSIKDYSVLLLELLNELNLNNCTIFAVHAGASIAIEMAAIVPNKVSKLILSGVPIFSEEERIKLHQNLPIFNYQPNGSHFNFWWDYFQNKWDDSIPIQVIQNAVMNVMKAGPNYDYGYREAFDYSPLQALSEINTLPIYLLTAKNDPLLAKNPIVKDISNVVDDIILDTPQHLAQILPEQTAYYIKNFIKGEK